MKVLSGIVLATLGLGLLRSFNPEAPVEDERHASQPAMNPNVKLEQATASDLENLVGQNPGKVVVIDIWAGW